jgi:anti-sigma B factor antagonist
MTGSDGLSILDVDVEQPAARTLVVRVRGELDVVGTAALDELLTRRLAAEEPARLVLDLDGVTLLSGPALDLLLRVHRRCRVRRAHLVLVGAARPAVNRPLRLAGLLPLFQTRPSVGAALRGVAHPVPAAR